MPLRLAARASRAREITPWLLMFVPLAILLAVVPPIAQDLSYHALADDRTFFGVPNFANVVSNAALLVVGVLGLHTCLTRGPDGALNSWTAFFTGVLLVAFGSTYYHWAPTNQTLVWDRLPMTIAAMGLFCALLTEHLGPVIERRLLPAALVVGVASVGWWSYADDLRLYAWVQFGPLLVLGYVLAVYPGRYSHRGYLALALAFYVMAKIAEFGDAAIYSATSATISGHTIKHLLSAIAALCIWRMLRVRHKLTQPART